MARRKKVQKLDPVMMGARQLELRMTQKLQEKFNRSSTYYWYKEYGKGPINVLKGRTEGFLLEVRNPNSLVPISYDGEVSVWRDGSLKIILKRTEVLDGMRRTEIIELY